jgi:integrase
MATIETRTTSSGSTRYRAKIRLPGSRPQSRTFASLEAAQTWAQQAETALRVQQQAPPSHRHTLSELVRRYRTLALPAVSSGTARWREVHLAWWEHRLGHLPLGEVTPAQLVEAREDLAQSRGPRTTRGYLATMEHAFKLAVEEWLWLDTSPMARVRKPKEPRGRVRYLSDEERCRLLEACRASRNRHLYPLVLLGLLTGCRKGELLGLRWSQVDFKRAMIVLEYTKNGDRRSVPLVSQAESVLREHGRLRRLDSPLVFPRSDGREPIDIRYSWHQALTTAEIDDFRMHDLRHSCASALAASGASLLDIAQILGHRSLSMTRRYTHSTEDHTRRTLERMADSIFS